MKKRSLISVYIVLFASILLSSCGKSDSNPGSNLVTDPVSYNPITNETLQDNIYFKQFSDLMVESSFIQMSFPYYADLNESTFLNFTEASIEESDNCNKLFGFLTFCTQVSSTNEISSSDDTFKRSFNKSDSSISHEMGSTEAALVTEFRAILARAEKYNKGYGRYEHYVQADNMLYIFDFSKPVYANPVYKQNLETKSGYRYITSQYLETAVIP